jgi:hypothetical protein
MKEELTTILEAMRAAHAELADYLVSGDRNAELAIAKLVGILERREVVRAMRSLRALEGPGAPQVALAEASGLGFARTTLRNQLLILSAARRTPPRGHSGGVRHPVAEGEDPSAGVTAAIWHSKSSPSARWATQGAQIS